MPAGSYYLGDPCYVVPDKDWSKFCDIFFENLDEPFKFSKGKTFLAFGTAYGDGVYTDNEGRKYPVDAGIIGLVPVGSVPKPVVNIHWPTHVIDFAEPFECENEAGKMTFGHLVINTADDEEDV